MSIPQCHICCHDYDLDARRPLIGLCGHSFCHFCIYNMKKTSSPDCPMCRRKDAFAKAVENYTVVEMLEMQLEQMMSTYECKNCASEYCPVHNLLLVGSCGHTFCQKCVTTHSNCRICKKAKAFRNPVPNMELMEMLDKQSFGQLNAPSIPQSCENGTISKENCPNRDPMHIYEYHSLPYAAFFSAPTKNKHNERLISPIRPAPYNRPLRARPSSQN